MAEGCYNSSECHKAFPADGRKSLICPKQQFFRHTVQAFHGPKNYFDVVLSVASINHLDEKSCIALARLAGCRQRVSEHLPANIAAMMKPGGRLIIMDAARHTTSLVTWGMRSPLKTPNIEWFQAISSPDFLGPGFWAVAAFGNPHNHLGQRQAASVNARLTSISQSSFPISAKAYFGSK